MSKRPPPSIRPTENRRTPLGPTILPYRGVRIFWPAIFVLNLISRGLWYFGYGSCFCAIFVWHHRRALSTGFWRAIALASLFFLIFDRVYETSATVSSVASDPKTPFYFPFAITNNSHLLTLRNIEWTCHVINVTFNVPSTIQNNSIGAKGIKNELASGEILNIPCRFMKTDLRVVSGAMRGSW